MRTSLLTEKRLIIVMSSGLLLFATCGKLGKTAGEKAFKQGCTNLEKAQTPINIQEAPLKLWGDQNSEGDESYQFSEFGQEAILIQENGADTIMLLLKEIPNTDESLETSGETAPVMNRYRGLTPLFYTNPKTNEKSVFRKLKRYSIVSVCRK